MDLRNQIITGLPITDPDELEDVLINVADKLSDSKEPIILESLMNALVDFYVFTVEPGNDIEDIGFLVSCIEDRVCDAVAFRKALVDNGAYDVPETDVRPLTVRDVQEINSKFGLDVPVGAEDAEDDDLPHSIDSDRYPEAVDGPVQGSDASDPDDIRRKDLPGMMKRFESDGFEITVKMVPKKEFE